MTASPKSEGEATVSAAELFETDFYLALNTLRCEAGGPADSGRRFERVVRCAFETHPYEYGLKRFEHVWLWPQWLDHPFGFVRHVRRVVRLSVSSAEILAVPPSLLPQTP